MAGLIVRVKNDEGHARNHMSDETTAKPVTSLCLAVGQHIHDASPRWRGPVR